VTLRNCPGSGRSAWKRGGSHNRLHLHPRGVNLPVLILEGEELERLKDLIKGSPVHERKLEFRSFPLEDGTLIVEGWLRDERLVSGFHWDGSGREPGVVHWMCARLLIGGFPPTILEAEAEMSRVPHDLCPTTLPAIQKVIGLSITSGYSERVRERIGGINGCSHLTHLLLSMGPAGLHGYWTQQTRRRRPLPRSLEEVPGLNSIVNSCKLWAKGGPLIQTVQAAIEEQIKNEEGTRLPEPSPGCKKRG
jgi:hypothetical protein